MGLGLAICRSILTAHGGKIWCDNNPGGGAAFGFSLPIFETKAEMGERAEAPSEREPSDQVPVRQRAASR
jgi:hypothetical protein